MSVASVVYWEDPVLSGALFGSVLVTLISLSYYSLITVVSYLALTTLALVLLVKIYSYVMVMLKKAEPGCDPLDMIAGMPITIPTQTVADLSPAIADSINSTVSELRRLLLVDNMVDTIKFGLSLWLLTYVGSWFNALTLIILGWIVAFTLPKVYLNNQAPIDEALAKVISQVEEVKEKVMALIPNKGTEKKE